MIEVKGNWVHDFISVGTVVENGKIRQNVNFTNNVEAECCIKSDCNIEGGQRNADKKSSSRIVLNPILGNPAPKIAVVQL